MATIVKTGGGVPVSDYEALQSQLSSLQNSYNSLSSTYSSYRNSHAHSNDEYNNLQSSYNSLSSEYSSYRNSHAHTNEEYDAHDIVRSKTIAIWCRWYGGEKGHQLMVDGTEIGYTGPNGDNSQTVYYTVTI